mgnify:FL=1
MKSVVMADVISMDHITDVICDLKISCPAIAKEAKAGQFVEVYPDNGVNLLSRPISICEINKEEGSLRLVFQIVGKGTKLFSELKAGDKIRVLGPCGNGYTLCEGKALLVGGGIGVPPLLETCKQLKGEKTVVLVFRSGSFLADEFEKLGAKVYVTTDDGSVGFKGNVVDLLRSENITGDMIYSCGPKVMLKFLSMYAEEKGIKCQVSMEERMACGIGACVGCVVQIRDGDSWTYKKVCKDGPVFDSKEVCW